MDHGLSTTTPTAQGLHPSSRSRSRLRALMPSVPNCLPCSDGVPIPGREEAAVTVAGRASARRTLHGPGIWPEPYRAATLEEWW